MIDVGRNDKGNEERRDGGLLWMESSGRSRQGWRGGKGVVGRVGVGVQVKLGC